jgi:hypothetical protein
MRLFFLVINTLIAGGLLAGLVALPRLSWKDDAAIWLVVAIILGLPLIGYIVCEAIHYVRPTRGGEVLLGILAGLAGLLSIAVTMVVIVPEDPMFGGLRLFAMLLSVLFTTYSALCAIARLDGLIPTDMPTSAFPIEVRDARPRSGNLVE